MKAKQLLALLLALLMVVTMFVSCGGSADTESETETTGNDETQGPSDTDPVETEVSDDLGDVNFANVNNPEITFFVRTGYEYEVYVEEATDDTMTAATYWRNKTVEERLGVTIGQINQVGGWSKYQAWNDTLRNAVQTETHDFDASMIYAGCASSLAIEGCYMDMNKLDMISLDKPWWNQNIRKESTVYGRLYFASGSIAQTQLSQAIVTWFNKDLYNEYFATSNRKDIYQVVRDGEWTVDYMYDLTSAVWVDNDTNGEKSSGDVVGFGGAAHGGTGGLDAWIYALGCDLTKFNATTAEPEACFYNEHTIQAYEKLVRLYSDNPGAFFDFSSGSGGETGDTSFNNNNMLMYVGSLGAGATYSGLNFNYGVLPLPKYDTEQDDYRSIPEATSSLETVISTVEADRVDMVSATVELMAAEAYKQLYPVYVEVVLKSQNANAPQDAEMVQLIIDSMVYSFGWIFSSTHMGNMGKAFRIVDGSRDLTQYYESNKSNYEAMIDLLIDGYASMV